MIEFNLLDEKNLGRNLLNQSVRLSRLFLSKASQNRMEFDFLGNVHIDPVEVFDFDLTFQFSILHCILDLKTIFDVRFFLLQNQKML